MIKVIGDQKKIVSEINITPLVDTLLVLLIIFMVTAPAMTRSVGIEPVSYTLLTLPTILLV